MRKMRQIECVAVATVLFMAACSLTSIFPSVKAASNLVIVSSSMFTDTEYQYPSSVNVTHVVGEVQNTGDAPAIPSPINATFYDASNAVLTPNTYDQTSGTMTMGVASSIVMLPGAKMPFDVQLTGGVVDHYTLSISDLGYNDSRDNKPSMVQILSSNFYDQQYLGHPARIVNGTIKNTGTGVSTAGYVWVTFYDANGTVVEMSFTFTDPTDLNSGVIGTYEVQAYRSQQQLPKIASYRVTAQSIEYTVISEQGVTVPEFTVVLVPLLLLVAMTAIFVFYKRGRLRSSNNNTPCAR
jgi:hypothetical protein